MQTILMPIILLILYGLFHSLLASFFAKDTVKDLLGVQIYEGLYRLFYNIVAVLTFLPILGYVATNAGNTVWNLEPPFSEVFLALQFAGLIGAGISVLQIDGWSFLGLRQLGALWDGKTLPLPTEPLQQEGLYEFMRHPLYVFSMMFLWFTPTMSQGYLGFCIGVTLYFVLGSLYEEYKMVKVYGDEYRAYQEQVPWMIPFTKFS